MVFPNTTITAAKCKMSLSSAVAVLLFTCSLLAVCSSSDDEFVLRDSVFPQDGKFRPYFAAMSDKLKSEMTEYERLKRQLMTYHRLDWNLVANIKAFESKHDSSYWTSTTKCKINLVLWDWKFRNKLGSLQCASSNFFARQQKYSTTPDDLFVWLAFHMFNEWVALRESL